MSDIDFQNGLAVGMSLAGKSGLLGSLIYDYGPFTTHAGTIERIYSALLEGYNIEALLPVHKGIYVYPAENWTIYNIPSQLIDYTVELENSMGFVPVSLSGYVVESTVLKGEIE